MATGTTWALFIIICAAIGALIGVKAMKTDN